LGLYGVFAVAEEAANAQVLLDPFEEQLDPPTASVEVGDGARGNVEVIGQEEERLAAFRVAIADAANLAGYRLFDWRPVITTVWSQMTPLVRSTGREAKRRTRCLVLARTIKKAPTAPSR
jgi:hypothetical protein